ncbi:hypothetical protein D770_24530 [Flammeovirgaceae bacterium 311]|nr:hypothetical protein D770_24530 [Flammeovirgaceae bacterium 311]
MPLRYFLCFILYTISFTAALAQKEASHWFFSPGGYMDFNQSPPLKKLLPERDHTKYSQFFSSISDASGELLFYTDGRTFFNSQHQIMDNGDGYYGGARSTQTLMIIPKPGCKDLYYSLVTELGSTNKAYSDQGWTIHYSVVDVAAGNGRGSVIVKNKVLTDNKGDALAVFEGADGASFWLVTRGNGDEISAYRITKAGINHCPVISKSPFTVGNGGHPKIKASPDSKHLVLINPEYFMEVLQVYSFDNSTGLFTAKFQLKQDYEYPTSYPAYYKQYSHYYEFSPDGNNLFIVEDTVIARTQTDVTAYSTLIKLDLNARSNKAFSSSGIKIFKSPPGKFQGHLGHMQLSPDGRLLMESFKNYLSAVNNPDSPDHFNFTEKAVVFSDWPGVIPTFPAFFFKKGGYHPSPPDLVCQVDLCAGSMLPLKAEHMGEGYTYEWTNSKTSEVFHGKEPVLSVPENFPDTTYYFLKITDKSGCEIFDVVKVVLLPAPSYEITGSKSVCPGVKEVAYWVQDAKEQTLFTWTVEGGEIVSGQGTSSIQVNWGSTNANARVKLTYTNTTNGCKGFLEFPVKVFKELETQKPSGATLLSCQREFYHYSILPTKGSYYHWQILNGEILEGQGSAAVKVDWHAESESGYLWIEESVNTDLEICFGRSDTLKVINPKAKLNQHIAFQFVTNVLYQPGELELHYKVEYPQLFDEALAVYHRKAGEANAAWEEVIKLSPSENKVVFSEPLSDNVIYDYQIRGRYVCGNDVESAIHNNIVLAAPGIDVYEQIGLAWNSYHGWENGVKGYELYRKLDLQENFSYLQTADASADITLDNLNDGFEHCFYVKATANGRDDHYSLSNVVCLTYDHPLFIPNVFTPNGDAINDYFEIKKIHLYPENKLTIYNRYGKIVYQESGYKNLWSAQNLPGGSYFYQLTIAGNKKGYKGWVEVLR